MSRIRFRRVLLAPAMALALAALPCHAAAAGAYVTVFGGATFQNDQAFDFRDGAASERGDAGLQGSFASGATLGYGWANGWRLEGEFAYQSVDRDDGTFTDAGPTGDGNYASTSVAVSAIYEFNALGSDSVRTYVGAGLAYLTEVDADFESGGGERSFSGDGFGVQLVAGARYDLGERWFVDAGLRYLTAGNLDLDEEGGGASIRADYSPWTVVLALGWRF